MECRYNKQIVIPAIKNIHNDRPGNGTDHTTENIGYRICRELDFDILLTGHQHMSIPGHSLYGTYTLQPMEYGKEAFCIKLVQSENGWRITSQSISPDLKIIQKDDKASERYEKVKQKMLQQKMRVQKWLDQPLGHLKEDLLPGERVQMALHGSPIADLLNEIQLFYSDAQISAVGLANEIAGFHKNVRTRDIIATYPYPNTLVVLKINGQQLKAVMERSAEYFEQQPDGSIEVDKNFLVPKIEHYNYDYYAGADNALAYEIHPEKEKGQRIENLTFEGKPICPEDIFTICINDYRATGAGEYPEYRFCKKIREINIEMVELMMNYFAEI